jgi:pyrroline-5-carboxylate reductase
MKRIVGFIGVDVMEEAPLASMIKSGVSGLEISISDKSYEKTQRLAKQFGCNVLTPSQLASTTYNIILVIKPHPYIINHI